MPLAPLVRVRLDKGLDLYEGGARYHVVVPCFTGLTTAINSLYAIQKMVFDKTTAVTSLPELVQALLCDWGYKMDEPFISTLAGPARIQAQAERFQQLRAVALELPRYGREKTDLSPTPSVADLPITCANPETFAGAAEDPEKYNLLRARMGGWSEFFVAMYPAHQSQHQRRPLSGAATPK